MEAGTAYAQRWGRIGEAARAARAVPSNRIAALVIVLVYNAAGFADVFSTVHGLSMGAYEANPLVRAFMEVLTHYWVLPKLGSQLLVSAMVLWFPHRVVLAIFSVAVAATAAVVFSNLAVIASL